MQAAKAEEQMAELSNNNQKEKNKKAGNVFCVAKFLHVRQKGYLTAIVRYIGQRIHRSHKFS